LKKAFVKIARGLLILWGVVTLVFFLLMLLPDPTTMAAGQRSDVLSTEAINKEFGLDKPAAVQYLLYLNDLSPISYYPTSVKSFKSIKGIKIINGKLHDLWIKTPYLRRSFQNKKRVGEILSEALPGTLLLAVSSLTIAAILGIIMGMICAFNQDKWPDRLLMIISNIGISFPSFLVAILFAWVFGYLLSAYTGLSMTGSMRSLDALGENYAIEWRNLILPSAALSIRIIGIICQLTRSSVLSVIKQEYILTARSKGLSKYQIIKNHVLKNALNPIVTALSGWFASLLAGAFFIEYIFNWKGLGKVTIEAVQNSDIPVVMGGIIFTACIFIVVNILVDFIYAALDPRVQI